MKQEEMIAIENCPICASESHTRHKEVADYSTSKEVFGIAKCQDCGFLFTNPIPAADQLGRFYQGAEYISHTNDNTSLFGKVYQLFRKINLATKSTWINQYCKKPGHLLDYGSGTGEFLKHMAQKSWLVRGVELADEVRDRAVKKYSIDVVAPNDFENVAKESFDAITLWHVLEHVPSLKSSFAKILSKLKKGGFLFVAVPNRESYDAQYYDQYWAAWDVPIHFYHFSKRDMTNLAIQHGLEIVAIKNMKFDAFYVSLLSEQYKTGKKNWLRATWVGLKSNLKGKKENTSSLTYIFRKL